MTDRAEGEDRDGQPAQPTGAETSDSEALLEAELNAAVAAAELDEERWRIRGTINNHLVSRYHPDALARWWREPQALLDGRTPESLVEGDFDPTDPLVRRLVELAKRIADAAPRPKTPHD